MPAYNFQKQFAVAVCDGTKRQTIRKPRKRPTKPGDTLYLYTGMRTKQCLLLRTEMCADVTPVNIEREVVRFQGGQALSQRSLELLAAADGFDSVQAFFDFFRKRYELPEKFEVIYW